MQTGKVTFNATIALNSKKNSRTEQKAPSFGKSVAVELKTTKSRFSLGDLFSSLFSKSVKKDNSIDDLTSYVGKKFNEFIDIAKGKTEVVEKEVKQLNRTGTQRDAALIKKITQKAKDKVISERNK